MSLYNQTLTPSLYSSRQSSMKQWSTGMPGALPPQYRYYSYNPYDQRKIYQMQGIPQYAQPEMSLQQNMQPIPISVPAGASLTPVSLQHVQLVPCMCPVAPEEADKLQEQVGPGPYLAQTYAPQSYAVPQQMTVNQDANKNNGKQ